MALPTKQKTWVFSPCNRITFVSLNDTMATYLFGIKTFLKANGYTVKGSCDGTTGAMDAVDRWATKANATTRGANTTTANSWIVLTDANGCNICLSYVGATDDVARLSFSPGGLYVAAGTPAFTPTATDEQLFCSGVSLINNTASADRLWSGMVSSDSKLCRFMIARSGVWVGMVWGVELLTPATTLGGAVAFSPAVWGFAYTVANMTIANVAGASAQYSANSKGGLARVVISSVPINIQVGGGGEALANSVAGIVGRFNDIQPELQGANGYPMAPIVCSSGTTSAQGKLGNRIDWWTGRSSGQADGDTYGTLNFIQVGQLAFPWDGTTTPTMT